MDVLFQKPQRLVMDVVVVLCRLPQVQEPTPQFVKGTQLLWLEHSVEVHRAQHGQLQEQEYLTM